MRGGGTGAQVPAVETVANQSTLSQLSVAAEMAGDEDVPHYLLGRYFSARPALGSFSSYPPTPCTQRGVFGLQKVEV